MGSFRQVADSPSKERIRVLLLDLPTGAVRLRLNDGTLVCGQVVREHQENRVDASGVWHVAAGLTLLLDSGGSRQIDLLDVTAIEPR